MCQKCRRYPAIRIAILSALSLFASATRHVISYSYMPDDDILEGWKAIANYLGTSERTAKRYRSTRGLPIQRPPSGSVVAFKRELKEWRVKPIRSAILVGSQLTALDALGETVWMRPLPGSLRPYSDDDLAWRVQVVQFPGQTKPGVLVVCTFLNPAVPDTIICFLPDGTEAWNVPAAPDLVDRNGRLFEKAWRYTSLVVSPSGAVWTSLANAVGWAGCVLKVDAQGKPTVYFANAGYVERLCVVASAQEDLIVACGENNDYDQAFIALFAANGAPCRSVPGERKVYRYSNAPRAFPWKYILFPRTELIEARGSPYGHVQALRQFPDRIVVHIETGERSQFLYHLSETLEPEYVFPSGGHEGLHRQMESAGLIDHAWIDCPELTKPLPLRIWDLDTGWRAGTIPWRDNPWKER